MLLLLLACAGKPDPGAPADPAPSCGDGRLDPGEDCDDGAGNSDTEPDACRTDCRAAGCGDGVLDAGEACDDGGPWGGDGCTPACAEEDGPAEVEPNQPWDQAEGWDGSPLFGALPEGDEDCFALSLSTCQSLAVQQQAPCLPGAVLHLHDPRGARIATGAADAQGCAALDPTDAEGARFLAAGTWTVCLAGLLGAEVPAWSLVASILEPEDEDLPRRADLDPDGDGLPDTCDPDRDGDGWPNEDDLCPDLSDGPLSAPMAPDADGFLRHWLATGPFDGLSSPSSCRPTEASRLDTDEAAARPALGDPSPAGTWRALVSSDARIDLLDFATVDAPREAYLATWIHSATARRLTLALGPDDGARAWLDDRVVLDIDGCQGTTADQFQAEVELPAGWSRLLLKVYDQGGGWGSYVRLLDAGLPVTDLELSLSPEERWSFDGGDLDGDGLGDLCDPSPAG